MNSIQFERHFMCLVFSHIAFIIFSLNGIKIKDLLTPNLFHPNIMSIYPPEHHCCRAEVKITKCNNQFY